MCIPCEIPSRWARNRPGLRDDRTQLQQFPMYCSCYIPGILTRVSSQNINYYSNTIFSVFHVVYQSLWCMLSTHSIFMLLRKRDSNKTCTEKEMGTNQPDRPALQRPPRGKRREMQEPQPNTQSNTMCRAPSLLSCTLSHPLPPP